jgi:uncharacterized protein YlxW (UPF0749 family)
MTEQENEHRASPLSRDPWRRRLQVALANRVRMRGARSWVWRLLAPFVFLLAGALLITSGVNADGTDLRAGRYTDLGSLLSKQKEETDQRRAEARRLTDEVNRLSEQVGDNTAQVEQSKAAALRGPAGLLAVKGPGLSVTLDDAPDGLSEAADPTEANKFIVHQQDIQAVVNALWAGGAEAMTIQGQRVISTTGIKCVGNTVRLHGVPYAPPYEITAIGDPTGMLTSMNDSAYIDIYMQYVESPDFQLGFDVAVHNEVELPGYEGSIELDYARPAGTDASRPDDSDV